MLKREQLLKTALLLVTLVAVFGMFAGSNEPVVGVLRGSVLEPHLYALHNGNSITFNLSVGYLALALTGYDPPVLIRTDPLI